MPLLTPELLRQPEQFHLLAARRVELVSAPALTPNPVVGQASCLSGGAAKLALDSHPMDASPDRRDACPTTASALRFGGSKRELLVGRILTPALSPRRGRILRRMLSHRASLVVRSFSPTSHQPTVTAISTPESPTHVRPPFPLPGGEGQGEGGRPANLIPAEHPTRDEVRGMKVRGIWNGNCPGPVFIPLTSIPLTCTLRFSVVTFAALPICAFALIFP